jgi:putative DNA primase/helicase
MKYFKKVQGNRGNSPFWKYRALCPAHNDHDPSLIIGISKDGKRMKFQCESKKCSEEEIIKKAKIPKELLIRNDPIAEWDYLNIDWEVEYKVRRYENPKRFSPWLLNKKDKWESVDWKKITCILFNLPYINTAREDEYIYFTEGEKDAENIRLKFSFCSTTTPGGSNTWTKTEDMSILKGRKVVFLPDKDEPGIKYARQIANYLLKEVGVKEVKIIELPNLVNGEDVSDWISKGGTHQALSALVQSAKPFASGVKELIDKGENTGLVLDPRDSNRIAMEYSEGCYNGLVIHHKGSTRIYDNGIYIIADNTILKQAFLRFLSLSCQKNMITKRIEKFFSNNRITNNVFTEFESYHGQPPTLYAPWWLGCSDGLPDPNVLILMKSKIFNLKKGKIMGEFNPKLVAFHKLNFDYDPMAQCPLWIEFLTNLCKEDPTIIDVLQQWFGYMISNSKEQEKMLLIVGPPRGGKGTIIHILTELIGKNNCAFPQISQLGGRFAFAQFIDKTGIFFNDVRTNKFTIGTRAIELLLSLTSKDRISVEEKFKGIKPFDLPGRIVMSTNSTPQFNDPTGVIHTRMILIKFTETFLGREDKNLLRNLMKELPGIFNWALEGWNILENQGCFSSSEFSEDEIRGDLDSSQQVKQFIMQNYLYGGELKEKDAYEFTNNMYAEYRIWCDPLGFIPGDIAQFGRELSSIAYEFGIKSVRKTDKQKSSKVGRQIQERAWLGLRRKKGGGGDF